MNDDVKQKDNLSIPSSPVGNHFISPLQFQYYGHNAKTRQGRNLWAAYHLDLMFVNTRITRKFHTSRSNCVRSSSWWCNSLIILLYAPIGLLLLVLRVVLGFPLTGLLAYLTPTSCSTCIFRCVACCCYGSFYRYKRLSPMTDEEREIEEELNGRIPRILVANHSSEMDVLPIRAKGKIRIMGYDFYKKMKFLQW